MCFSLLDFGDSQAILQLAFKTMATERKLVDEMGRLRLGSMSEEMAKGGKSCKVFHVPDTHYYVLQRNHSKEFWQQLQHCIKEPATSGVKG